MKDTCSNLNLTSMLENKLLEAGPDISSEFNDRSLHLELQSNAILIFSLLSSYIHQHIICIYLVYNNSFLLVEVWQFFAPNSLPGILSKMSYDRSLISSASVSFKNFLSLAHISSNSSETFDVIKLFSSLNSDSQSLLNIVPIPTYVTATCSAK